VINAQTAKVRGLEIPPTLLATGRGCGLVVAKFQVLTHRLIRIRSLIAGGAMRNALIGALFLLACGATSMAHAQQQPASPAAPNAAGAPNAPTPEDLAALSDARIAALKEGLKLRPDQQKNWAPFEATVRDLAKQRQDRIKQAIDARIAAQGQPLDPIAALRQRADSLTRASADLKRFADAAEPLYKSLDDGQKRRMIVLVTNVAPR